MANTGTGKTAAFLLPLIEYISVAIALPSGVALWASGQGKTSFNYAQDRQKGKSFNYGSDQRTCFTNRF